MEIGSHGQWIGMDPVEHKFDKNLADAIVKFAENKGISTIKDIGCGQGLYVKHFNDFAEPVDVGTAEMIVSLEVGEHIPKEYESTFLNNLINHTGSILILSWAIPDQGGFGHVNCHTNTYIIEKVSEQGLKFYFDYSMNLRMNSTLTWFKRTIMVFVNDHM